MKYSKYNYKYQLKEDVVHCLDNFTEAFSCDYFSCSHGTLVIKKGYAWDGCSGPTIDTKNSMKAGLVHDCLYQAMRLGLMSETYKSFADKTFYKILRENKMNIIRAKVWYLGVKLFAASFCKKGNLQGKDSVVEA